MTMTTTSLFSLARVVLPVLAAALLAGCGTDRPTRRGCIVVDVSPLPLRELTRSYPAGFERFVQRAATTGSGDICFAFAAQGMSGGTSAWANFACATPKDELRCAPEIRQKVAAATSQLAAAAEGAGRLHGASELVEAIALVAPALRPGDEILLLSDAIQNSQLTGDFTRQATTLDPRGIRQILDKLADLRLLPDLSGRTLRIPYALYSSERPLNMRAPRREAVRAFWEAYAQRTGAALAFGGGAEAA